MVCIAITDTNEWESWVSQPGIRIVFFYNLDNVQIIRYFASKLTKIVTATLCMDDFQEDEKGQDIAGKMIRIACMYDKKVIGTYTTFENNDIDAIFSMAENYNTLPEEAKLYPQTDTQILELLQLFYRLQKLGALKVPVGGINDNTILLPNGDKAIPLADGRYGFIQSERK